MLNTAVSIANFVGDVGGTSDFSKMTPLGMVFVIVFVIIYVILVLLLGKWLFNTVLCSLFPAVHKATSVWQMLGLMVLLHLLFP